ncbi:MAG TPA: aldo/keto reductase [Acidimicrobiales bacterium]|nr:aldo/keto reductase [Acidimicrobiales bacterium]
MTTSPELRHPGGIGGLAGRSVSRIGFGAMQLARLRADSDAAGAVVRRAVEGGVDHIDTAQFYGGGSVNDILRQALAGSEHVVVVTKVGATVDPGAAVGVRLAQRPEELRTTVEDNLRSLGRERLDVVNLRRVDAGPGIRAEGDQVVDLEDQLAAMIAMREEGKIGAIGLSAVTIDGLRAALPVGIACVQNAYSLLNRADEALLDLCLDEGVAWVPFFLLGGAFPGLPKVVDNPIVQTIATRIGATPSQVGLAWLLAHAPHILLVPGTASSAHLNENLGADEVQLTSEDIAVIDGIAPSRQP